MQKFEADVTLLTRLTYSETLENIMERFAIQVFLDGPQDYETRH